MDGAAALAASSPEKAEETKAFLSTVEAAKGDKPKYKGIAVLGSHPETVLQAPFDDPEWLIYACSPHNLDYKGKNGRDQGLRFLDGGRRPDGGTYRVDEWFEVHLPIAHPTRPYHYLRNLEFLPKVWMRDKESLCYFKGGREYPERTIKERFGPFFFTSSIAFLMAKAIVDCEAMGIPEIGIWGVMQASETEYFQQRPGIQYFIWEARRAGIRVGVPEEARHLLDAPKENF